MYHFSADMWESQNDGSRILKRSAVPNIFQNVVQVSAKERDSYYSRSSEKDNNNTVHKFFYGKHEEMGEFSTYVDFDMFRDYQGHFMDVENVTENVESIVELPDESIGSREKRLKEVTPSGGFSSTKELIEKIEFVQRERENYKMLKSQCDALERDRRKEVKQLLEEIKKLKKEVRNRERIAFRQRLHKNRNSRNFR